MTELAATAAIPIRSGPGGGASYSPTFRVGAGLGLGEPDESWSLAELVADLRFHRSLAALSQFSYGLSPDSGPLPGPSAIPQQRTRGDAAWDQYLRYAADRYIDQQRRRSANAAHAARLRHNRQQRGHL